MESAKKLDIITIEDKFSLSNSQIYERAIEIAQSRGFENGWEVSEVRTSGPTQQVGGINIHRFDVFGFESSESGTRDKDQRSASEITGKTAAAPSAEA